MAVIVFRGHVTDAVSRHGFLRLAFGCHYTSNLTYGIPDVNHNFGKLFQIILTGNLMDKWTIRGIIATMGATMQTDWMASKKKPSGDERYRKAYKMVRIRGRLAKQGQTLALRLDKKLTEIVNDALRKALEDNGLWPPPER